MVIKNIFSLLLFSLFILNYCAKLILQSRRNKIKAFVLGKGNKPQATKGVELVVRISTLIWGTTWVLQAILEPLIHKLLGSIFEMDYRVGLAVITLGLMTFVKAMTDMKSSWRVGIDEETKSSLITNGIYQYSRNPAFVGFDLSLPGYF